MDIKEEDFPTYQVLAKSDKPGLRFYTFCFKRAQTGADKEMFEFLCAIQSIAKSKDMLKKIPGLTKEANEKTLRSCRIAFEKMAATGHASAIAAVAYCKANGLGGLTPPPEKQKLIKKALHSCRDTFEKIAHRGYKEAKAVVDYLKEDINTISIPPERLKRFFGF